MVYIDFTKIHPINMVHIDKTYTNFIQVFERDTGNKLVWFIIKGILIFGEFGVLTVNMVVGT